MPDGLIPTKGRPRADGFRCALYMYVRCGHFEMESGMGREEGKCITCRSKSLGVAARWRSRGNNNVYRLYGPHCEEMRNVLFGLLIYT